MIPCYQPHFTRREYKSVARVLRSGFLASGPEVKALESEYSKPCGDQYCVAVSSATAGIYLVCKYMKLRHGWSEVNIPAYTFCATKQAADAAGLKTNIRDITFGYEIENSNNIAMNIDVIFAGNKERQDTNYYEYKSFTIHDAAHCFPYNNPAEARVYSFYPTKPLGANGGGMIVTPDKQLADWCRRIRQHGREESVGHAENPRGIGFNFWMSDLNAALVRAQLKKIDYLKESRNGIARRYVEVLKGIDCYYGDHLFMIRTDKREQIEVELKKASICYSRPYIPIADREQAPNAWRLYDRSLSLPYYTALTKGQQKYIIDTIKRVAE